MSWRKYFANGMPMNLQQYITQANANHALAMKMHAKWDYEIKAGMQKRDDAYTARMKTWQIGLETLVAIIATVFVFLGIFAYHIRVGAGVFILLLAIPLYATVAFSHYRRTKDAE